MAALAFPLLPAPQSSPRLTSSVTNVPPNCGATAPGWLAWSSPSWGTPSSRPWPRWSGGALAQLRFTPVLCASGPNGLSEADYVNMLLDQHASGVIFAGGNFAEADSSHVHYQLLRDRALPVVLVNASSDDLAFAQVSTDDAVATEQAFNHLQTLGHRRGRDDPRPRGPHAEPPPSRGVRDAHPPRRVPQTARRASSTSPSPSKLVTPPELAW